MKVVILGAGRRGIRLARHLVEENEAVIIIDADAEVFAAVLSGNKDFYAGIAEGSITVNGNTDAALLFAKAFFG